MILRKHIVVGIDSRKTQNGQRAWRNSGSAVLARDGGRSLLEWVREVQERGAGEIVLNCMDSDGVRSGYDLEQLSLVRRRCNVPLIASGGAGAPCHFSEVFALGVDGALAASLFHSGELRISGLKRYLRTAGVEIRL
jgi:cyclase